MAKNVHFLRISDDWNAAEMESFFPLISPERRIRIQRLRVAADRKAALFAGLLTRLVVSSELGIPQHALQFTQGTYGKPAVQAARPLNFSLSHTRKTVVLVCDAAPIGVDAEELERNISGWEKLAERHFTPAENLLLQNSRNPAKCFLTIWTAKEAYVKRLGTGLHTPFDSFDTCTQPEEYGWRSAEHRGTMVTVCSRHTKQAMTWQDWTEEQVLEEMTRR